MMIKAPHNCTEDSRGSTQGADWQDKKLGKGIRWWTTNRENNKSKCTVCGSK